MPPAAEVSTVPTYLLPLLRQQHSSTAVDVTQGRKKKCLSAIMQDQDEFITRDANFEDVDLVANDRAILEEIGYKADL